MPKLRKCCVVGCDANNETHRLFSFPKDDKLRELWLSHLIPVNVELSGLSKAQLLSKRVCQKHFDRHQFDNIGNRLAHGYPCLFTEKEILHRIPLSSLAEHDLSDHNYALQSTFLENSTVSTQSTTINAEDVKSEHDYTLLCDIPQEATSAADGTGESLTRVLNMSSSSNIIRTLGRPAYAGGCQSSSKMQSRSAQSHRDTHTPTTATSNNQDVEEDTPMETDNIHSWVGDITNMAKAAMKAKKGRSSKRLRTDEDEGEENQIEIMRVIAKLTKITADLVKIVSENANSKLEIKTGVRDLKGQIEHLNKKTREWGWKTAPQHKTRVMQKNTMEKRTQTDNEAKENPQYNTQSSIHKQDGITQTEEDFEDGKYENNLITELKQKIASCNNFSSLNEITNCHWRKEAYKITKVENANPLTYNRNWGIATVAIADSEEREKPKRTKKTNAK